MWCRIESNTRRISRSCNFLRIEIYESKSTNRRNLSKFLNRVVDSCLSRVIVLKQLLDNDGSTTNRHGELCANSVPTYAKGDATVCGTCRSSGSENILLIFQFILNLFDLNYIVTVEQHLVERIVALEEKLRENPTGKKNKRDHPDIMVSIHYMTCITTRHNNTTCIILKLNTQLFPPLICILIQKCRSEQWHGSKRTLETGNSSRSLIPLMDSKASFRSWKPQQPNWVIKGTVAPLQFIILFSTVLFLFFFFFFFFFFSSPLYYILTMSV